MNVKWLFSSYTLERSQESGFPRLDKAASNANLEISVDDVPASWLKKEPICVVIWGPKQFNLKMIKDYGKNFIPGSFYNLDKLSYSGFSPYLSKYMLNDDFVLLPYAEMVRRRTEYFDGPIFIRPDKTTKEFTGQVLTEEKFDSEINALQQLAHPYPETLCVVSAAKSIESEFRFVIADNKVVTGSEYRWDNVLDIRQDVLPEAQEMAETIAMASWQADRVYVCDICMSNGTARLLELNPFSSSGLYACDTTKIIDAVSKAAWGEFTGEDL